MQSRIKLRTNKEHFIPWQAPSDCLGHSKASFLCFVSTYTTPVTTAYLFVVLPLYNGNCADFM